jgi:hypothetical protein
MTQEIITYLILSMTAGALLYKTLRFFGMFGKGTSHSECLGCSGNCRRSEIFPAREKPTKNYG